MKVKLIFSLFVGITFLLNLQSCVQSCKIMSEPSGANVYIRGRLKGNTPYKYTTTLSNHEKVPIFLSLPGHESIDTFLKKDGKIDPVIRTMGYIFVVPLDFDRKFKPKYVFTLTPKVKKSTETTESLNVKTEVRGEDTKINKLLNLQKAYNEGLITNEEFVRLKKQVLEDKDN